MPTIVKSPTAQPNPRADRTEVSSRVTAILDDIRDRGDAAVREWSATFDHWTPENFLLSPADIDRIVATVPDQVIEDIRFVQSQVRGFAQRQLESMSEFEMETLPGVFLGQRHIPIGRVGAYVPGGRYPLTASAHMTIVTAKVAGVPSVAACTLRSVVRSQPRP